MSEQTVHFLRDYDQLAEDALQLGFKNNVSQILSRQRFKPRIDWREVTYLQAKRFRSCCCMPSEKMIVLSTSNVTSLSAFSLAVLLSKEEQPTLPQLSTQQ